VGYRLATSKSEFEASPEVVLAVLPFDCTPANPGSSWLSDGIAEAVLNTLAAGTSIRVIGRSSSFQFRGANKAVGIVKAALRITHVVDGLVQQDGDTIRVTVQLIEADQETIVWSERIDEPSDAVLGLGDRVAEHVAAALDRAFAAHRRPRRVDARAYELYLRGAKLTRNIDPRSQSTAVSLLTECVQLAPELADGWGNLALARAQLGFFQQPSAEARAQATRDARRALEIDPGCASARLVPYVGGPVFDFSEHRIYETPAPSNHGRTASPDVSFGVQMLEQGRISEALAFFALAERYDPLFQIRIFYHSLALLCDGSIEDGLARLESAAARWPDLPFFLATRLRWAAAAGDWATVDRFTRNDGDPRHSLGPRAPDVYAWIEFNRNPELTIDDFLALRAGAFADGRSGLEELLLYGRTAGIEHVLEHLDASGEAIVNVDAARRPDEIGTIALWLPIYDLVRRSPGFTTLEGRILPSPK
jgi:TolB-like protein